uniref:Uncharacterized protein n=1 Tax=Myotis myotis TaxID=51298 RepID=A0A7J7UDA5_MYOMY|nr:hypothetical protein mMyoMyo1_008793 [Myotis myotis]
MAVFPKAQGDGEESPRTQPGLHEGQVPPWRGRELCKTLGLAGPWPRPGRTATSRSRRVRAWAPGGGHCAPRSVCTDRRENHVTERNQTRLSHKNHVSVLTRSAHGTSPRGSAGCMETPRGPRRTQAQTRERPPAVGTG